MTLSCKHLNKKTFICAESKKRCAETPLSECPYERIGKVDKKK